MTLPLELWTDNAYQELPPPWDHQVDDLSYLLRGSFALYWEPRLGKTRECGEALRILDAEDKIDGVIVLPPVNAKDTWGRAFDLFLPHWQGKVLSGLKGEPILPEYQWLICNPNILQPQTRGAELFGGWLYHILKWMQGRKVVLIEDESHQFFTTPSTKMYKAAASLSRLANRTWQLTGTPIEKSGLDIHWQLKHLGQRYPYYNASRDQFGQRFCTKKKNPFRGVVNKWGRPVGGYDYGLFIDPDGFWHSTLGVASRLLRRDCLDVPLTRRMDVWVDEVAQPSSPNTWGSSRREIQQLKVDHTVNYVRGLLEDGEGPVLVGGHHRVFTEAVAKKLHAPLVYGGVPGDARARIYNDFEQGKHDVLVGNIRSMGTSIELVRAHHCVIGELTWVARDLRQFEDRLQGEKQKHEVLIHYLLIRHSWEEHVWDSVLIKGKGMDDLDEAARRLHMIEMSGASMAELEDVE